MAHRTFSDAHAAFARKETTAEQLVSSFLQNATESPADLNILLSSNATRALEEARQVDKAMQEGTLLPLAGMVLAVKDVICIKGERVTCGSRMLEDFESLYDATVIARLREAGAVVVGKTNCDEFAMGSSTENSYFGATQNPAAPGYVPGGSSGGSAAAVAAGLCHTSLGSDTGGSIRQPASFCGVVGLKPTYGRVSRFGLVAYASSFDCIGPFAHSVPDIASVLQVVAGHDPHDATSAPVEVPDYQHALHRKIEGLRIGLPEEYFAEGLDPDIRSLIEEQIEQFKRQGAIFKKISLPHTEYGIATYYVLAMAEASSNLARYDGVRYGYRADMKAVRSQIEAERSSLEAELESVQNGGDSPRVKDIEALLDQKRSLLTELYVHSRSEGFGKEVKRRIMLGTYVLSSGYYDAYYGKAQRVRALIRRDFDTVFEDVDVLLTPASPTPAFEMGSMMSDPLEMYLTDVYTVTANLAGVPGLVVPVGNHPDGRPVGMQFLAPHFGEEVLLQAGHAAMELAYTAV